ncbi:MAG: prepilin peptidase, partial [Rhodobacterales bacterium]|nr:prepilin peptidase [Rhodobacterales bacterium]
MVDPATLFLILAAPFVGSFLGVLVLRLPEGRPVLLGRSACPHCGTVLGPRDLVPLVSWLLLRRRCRACGTAIPPFYPLIELAALGVALWAVATAPNAATATAGCLLGWALLALAEIDRRHMLLPDALTLPLLALGLAATGLLAPDQMINHLIGAAAGFAVLAGLALLYRRLRGRDGLGLGDAKLLAAAGAWVGWEGLPGVVLIGAATGLAWVLVAGRLSGRPLDPARPLPFGPFLALGLWLVWLY